MPRAGGARGRGSGQVPKSKQKAKKVKLITSPKQKPGQQKPKRKKNKRPRRENTRKALLGICSGYSSATPPSLSAAPLAKKIRKRNAIWAKVVLVAVSAFRLTNAKCARILISAGFAPPLEPRPWQPDP